MSVYRYKPDRLLTCIAIELGGNPQRGSYCAGFESKKWRCDAYARHLIDWIADYALKEDELRVSHGNMYVRLREAAVRIYKTKKYKTRGEIGEISIHAICRDFFDTIPFAPRVFYLTSSNDVVKSFDMAHVRYIKNGSFELWLGESKLFKHPGAAIAAAIKSVKAHIDQGFLNAEKLLLGPQVSKELPRYEEIRALLSEQSSLDALFKAAVFPVCIVTQSDAVLNFETHCDEYKAAIEKEISALNDRLVASKLQQTIKILLIYVPIESKQELASAFDQRLKGLLV